MDRHFSQYWIELKRYLHRLYKQKADIIPGGAMVQDGKRKSKDMQLYVLVLRCQAGDERAFGDLYYRFRSRTLRYLQGLLDKQSADDVHQELWLTVYRKISTLANPGGFKTWLYQVTRNSAIDFLRRKKRQTEFFTTTDEAIKNRSISPEDEFLPVHDTAYLERAKAALSPAHRDVLMLRYWEDMSYGEIALVVGCSIGTVRSRLHHAKCKMKERLELA